MQYQTGFDRFFSHYIISVQNNSFTSEDTKQFIHCFKCQRELPNDLQNNVGSSEAEQIICQTPLKKKFRTEELEKVSNKNKSYDDSTVNNPVAANESSNVIRPVAGITVTTNATISTDAGTGELEKVSNENKSKDDSTVNNPVAAKESSNVIRPAADITVTTNAAISTDAGTEELEKVSNKNKSKDDSTVNNPVAANESSNVVRPVAGITVTTNAVISIHAGTEELEKVSNKNKCKDDSTVNNPIAAN